MKNSHGIIGEFIFSFTPFSPRRYRYRHCQKYKITIFISYEQRTLARPMYFKRLVWLETIILEQTNGAMFHTYVCYNDEHVARWTFEHWIFADLVSWSSSLSINEKFTATRYIVQRDELRHALVILVHSPTTQLVDDIITIIQWHWFVMFLFTCIWIRRREKTLEKHIRMTRHNSFRVLYRFASNESLTSHSRPSKRLMCGSFAAHNEIESCHNNWTKFS